MSTTALTIESGQTRSSFVTCNDLGDIMTAAGYNISNPNVAEVQIVQPGLNQAQYGWTVAVRHTSPGGFSTTYTLHGKCLDVTP